MVMNLQNERSTRAGTYIKQKDGYSAFFPSHLPPEPPIKIDTELADLLSKADLALGRLDGAAEILPNPDLFVTMYVRKEAVLSSQIEGTQASLEDVLAYEVISERRKSSNVVSEVVNYIEAMNNSIKQLDKTPFNIGILREAHKTLLRGARGAEKSPGEFRKRQNWIGVQGSDIFTASYIPPPPAEVDRTLSQLEMYINSDTTMPILIKCGLVHAQFESIHPFLDGNGRLGRLLITLLLCQHKVIKRPLLYLSAYFKLFRSEYYDKLQEVRDYGNWENWLKFFLRGIWTVSEEAFSTVREIVTMREEHRNSILKQMRSPANGLLLLEHLFKNPLVTVEDTKDLLHVTYPAANSLIEDFVFYKLLRETTGKKRNRLFLYEPYLALLRKGTEL
jgi:Fic family protein